MLNRYSAGVVLVFAAILIGAGPGAGTVVGAFDASDAEIARLLPDLTESERETLGERGKLRSFSERAGAELRLMPRVDSTGSIRDLFRSFSPTITSEVVHILPLPAKDRNGTELTSTGETLRHLHNTLRAVSTLSGITYGSAGTTVLFSDVYAIRSLRDRRQQPDSFITELPDTIRTRETTKLIHLVDVHFGTSFFEATYLYGPDSVGIGIVNARALTYVLPVVSAGNVRFQLIAVPLSDNLLLYGAVGADAGPLIRQVADLPSFFRLRIEALVDWFAENAYTTKR